MITYPQEIVDALIENQHNYVWETKPYARYERGRQWYLGMTIVAVFLVAYAIWTSNFLFAFLILLMGILLILAGNDEPATVLVQLGENGVVWDGKLYLYQDIQQFSVVYQPPLSKILYLEVKGLSTPRIRIPLEEQDPSEIRAFLKDRVDENLDLQTEHLSDILGRLLKI